jgi:hypothetical protein
MRQMKTFRSSFANWASCTWGAKGLRSLEHRYRIILRLESRVARAEGPLSPMEVRNWNAKTSILAQGGPINIVSA